MRIVLFAGFFLVACHAHDAVEDDAGVQLDGSVVPADGSIGMPPVGDGGRACPAPVVLGSPGDCDPSTTGLTGPKPICTSSNPCMEKIGGDGGMGMQVDSEINSSSGMCGTDPVISWTDSNGDARWACVHTPPGGGPHPLIVYFAGSLSDADVAYSSTGLPTKANTVDISQGADAAGYVLIIIQERNLHDNTDGDGQHWDADYRDLVTDSCNPDVRSADYIIDRVAGQTAIDPKRIYSVGWSNGAFFAQMYGIARHTTPTPGGHKVAATAIYAGADPFGPLKGSSGNCQLSPYPKSTLPIYVLHRSCDAFVACDAAQDTWGSGYSVEAWMTTALPNSVGDLHGQDVLIDGLGATATMCQAVPPCTLAVGTLNHLNWPNGGDGHTDWEPMMLSFLAANPLP
jgi:dienelactone hydrolase